MTAFRSLAPPRRRHGFSMIEMMTAMTLFLLVLAASIPFFRMQARAVDSQTGRMDAVQNTRYANTVIDRELRLAGGVTGQPIIVQASPWAVTFNVDLVTRLPGDPGAVYYNPDADSLGTEGWLTSRAKALPTVSTMYPSVNYRDPGGVLSSSETISFFVAGDASTSRTDDYVLYRRVNDRDSTIIARNVIIPGDTAYFFRYWRVNASGTLVQLTSGQLPLYWNSASGWADSIRTIDMRVSSLYREPRTQQDVVRTVYSSTRLLNSGMLRLATCGASPLAPPSVTADTLQDLDGHVAQVRVTWSQSLEETGGERDVTLYVVARRLAAGTEWFELRNVPANNSTSYSFDDTDIAVGTWVYGVYAQDCNPSNSSYTQSSNVVIP
jgi:prepilin-type N-terminal cleavage/methylation domain-containing protein